MTKLTIYPLVTVACSGRRVHYDKLTRDQAAQAL